MVVEPQGLLTWRSSTLTFLGRFLPVSWTITLFWGLGVISTIDESWGAFTFRSSTLAVLADSDPFRGLLLTVFGP